MTIELLDARTRLEDYAEMVAAAFHGYPVMNHAFAKAPGSQRDWIRKLARASVQSRSLTGCPVPVAVVDGRIVGGTALEFPHIESSPESKEPWEVLVKEAGPEMDSFFQRFIAAAETVDVPRPNLLMVMLAVHPDFQGQGIGRELIENTVRLARELGLTGVSLDTEVETNVHLYEHCGFEVLGEREVDGMPIWVMYRPV